MMEVNTFRLPAVAAELEAYVEARLHTDGKANIERILELQEHYTGSAANPIYVIVDTQDESIVSKFEGSTFDPQEFIDFLVKRS